MQGRMAFATVLSVLACAVLAHGSQIHRPDSEEPPPLVWSGPTGQPPTRAQDRQLCGMLYLPARIQMVAQVPTWRSREGRWETTDGATLATWSQDYFTLAPRSVSYNRQHTPLFKAKDLGGGNMSYEDCEGEEMYSMRVHEDRFRGKTYHILNQEGELVAQGQVGFSAFYPEQVLFRDMYGEPIAVAESPAVAKPYDHDTGSQFYTDESKIASDQQALWQVYFYGASTSNSSMVHMEQRWVVTAAVQDIALQADEVIRPIPNLRGWLAVTWLLTAMVVAGVCCSPIYIIVARAVKAPEPEKFPIYWEGREPWDYGSVGGRLPVKNAP